MGRLGLGTGGEDGASVPMNVLDVTEVDGLEDVGENKIDDSPAKDELDVVRVGGPCGGDESCVLKPSRGLVVGGNTDGDDGRDTVDCLNAERRIGGDSSCICVDGSDIAGLLIEIGRAHV